MESSTPAPAASLDWRVTARKLAVEKERSSIGLFLVAFFVAFVVCITGFGTTGESLVRQLECVALVVTLVVAPFLLRWWEHRTFSQFGALIEQALQGGPVTHQVRIDVRSKRVGGNRSGRTLWLAYLTDPTQPDGNKFVFTLRTRDIIDARGEAQPLGRKDSDLLHIPGTPRIHLDAWSAQHGYFSFSTDGEVLGDLTTGLPLFIRLSNGTILLPRSLPAAFRGPIPNSTR